MSAIIQTTSEVLLHQAEASMAQGDIRKTEQCLADLLKETPNDDRALALMAEVRLRAGNVQDAFAFYMRAVNAAPTVYLYKERFLELAGRGLNVSHSEQLEAAVVACLKTPELSGAVENWSALLMADPDFQAVYRLRSRQPSSMSRGHMNFGPLFRPLFLEGMKSNVVCDPAFEAFVSDVRRHLFVAFWDDRGGLRDEHIVLASALSHYAFFTDFILDETEREQERIGALRRRIETGAASDEAAVALFACYRPLYVLANANRILETFKDNEILSDVVKAQIADHIFLGRLAASIPTLMPVADETSQKVRDQYEAFPYPRWKTLSKHRVLENWRAEDSSQRLEGPLSNGPATLLIAGCGTGRDAAIHAIRFPQASITAVDVSRTSLAYASMKAKEMDLENLTFMQGDILDLGRMGQRFDYICCTGVLHHMEDPLSGWRVLGDLLKPGGLMRIGLYSRAGRKAVALVQDVARRRNDPPTRDGILRFRRECPAICDRETLLGLSRLQDYYHLSMYRDLLFPAREHQFNLAQIDDMLSVLGLSFEGFYISADVLAKHRAMFREDRHANDLESWRQFESRYPDTFASMYIFWCRKTGP